MTHTQRMQVKGNSVRRRAQVERGTQLVELAIVIPILLMLLAAAAEFGNYYYTYTTLTKATRVAARYLTVNSTDTTEQTVAKNLAVCGSTSACGTGTAIVKGLTTSNIQITVTNGAGTEPATVTVAIINYNYASIVDLGRWTGGLLNNIAVSPSTTMRSMQQWY